MAGTHEIMAGFHWLESVLSADATLSTNAPGGIWRGLAPPGTATPFIVMSFQSGSDSITANAFRMLSLLLFQVKCVGPASSTAAIVAAAYRIDQLIGSPPTSGSTTGALVLASYRESPLVVDELVNGETWTNVGGLYRLEVEATP